MNNYASEGHCEVVYVNYLIKQNKLTGRELPQHYETCQGIRNYWDGDEVFYYKDHIERVDYKYVKNYVSIELVQVSADGNFDSWLYNSNIHKIVYIDQDDQVYEFDRQYLLNLAYLLLNNFDLRRTSTVYRDDIHSKALAWALEQLRKNISVNYFRFRNLKQLVNSISTDGVHMNVAHNSSQAFSALNIRIPVKLF